MCLFQIVDAISETPTVLLDLSEAFGVAEGSSFTPPAVRRTNSWTALADGTTEPASTYGDREIVLTLDGTHGTAEEQVARLQKLGRLLSSPQWLKVHPPGMTHPVFFRTRRAEARVVEQFMTERPQRGLEVTIPADPFAYGLPESSTVVIDNHPLAGTNRMCAVLPPAKGDVPAPLLLSFDTPAEHPLPAIRNALYRSVVGSRCPRIGVPTARVPTSAPLGAGVGFGTSVSGATADSSCAAGTRRRVTPTQINGERVLSFSFNVATASDHRIFARVRLTGFTVTLNAAAGNGRTRDVVMSRNLSSTMGYEWVDLGVLRLPASSIDTTDAFGLSPAVATADVTVGIQFLNQFNQTLDFDVLMAVPVGSDATHATQSTARMTSPDFSTTSPTKLTLDGINDRRYASWLTDSGAFQRHQHVSDVAGGLPVITPARSTQLFLMPVVTLDPTLTVLDQIGDPLGVGTVVSWLYFPRYLYLRGIE